MAGAPERFDGAYPAHRLVKARRHLAADLLNRFAQCRKRTSQPERNRRGHYQKSYNNNRDVPIHPKHERNDCDHCNKCEWDIAKHKNTVVFENLRVIDNEVR